MVIDRHVRRIKGEELPPVYSFRIIHKDGNIRWVEVNVVLINWKDKTATLNFLTDITERKQMEVELHKGQEIYRLITDNSNDWIYLINPEGKFKYVSPSSGRITGYTSEEFVNNSELFLDIIHPDDKEHIKFHLETVNETPEPQNLEFRIITKKGELRWISHTCVPVYNDRGQYSGRSGTNRDINERKLSEIQLEQTLESLRKAFSTTIQVMVSAVEARDPYTSGHQIRSANIARAIATEMGLSQDKIESIRMAGPIHDIGKLSVPAEILSKPGKPSQLEFSLIKEHARKGYEMLKDVESPWPLAEIVYQHHERMNGSGYPRNLKGDEILIDARIMAVADVVESMASHRPYRAALGINAALEELEKNRGTHYDADVADACLRLFREKGFQIEGT
jgi:PAS domain S-box-containing protein/putative nucleotidyltransferase with HDIG domain